MGCKHPAGIISCSDHTTGSIGITTGTSKSKPYSLLSATKLRRLCFYTCLSFCSQGGLPQCMMGYHPPGKFCSLRRWLILSCTMNETDHQTIDNFVLREKKTEVRMLYRNFVHPEQQSDLLTTHFNCMIDCMYILRNKRRS